MNRTDVFQAVTDRIIAGLEQGVVPWQNPLREGYPLPSNLVSGKPYSGSNALLLSMNEYAIPYYATFNQVKQLGGKVKESEIATEIIFWDIRVSNKETKEAISQDDYLALEAIKTGVFFCWLNCSRIGKLISFVSFTLKMGMVPLSIQRKSLFAVNIWEYFAEEACMS